MIEKVIPQVIQRKLIKVVSPATNDENIGPDAVHLLAIKQVNIFYVEGFLHLFFFMHIGYSASS